jgi:hypothetical protein
MAFQISKTINGIPCPEAFAKVMEITTVRVPAHEHEVNFQVWYNKAAYDSGERSIAGVDVRIPYDPTATAGFSTIYTWAKANEVYFSGAIDVIE